MKNTTFRFENFLMFDYQGVEQRLEKMAAKGWRLEKIGPYGWTYRRAEPAQVRYAVTYIPDASDFNPEPTPSQQGLEDYCAQAGWYKVMDWWQMQIFCNEDPNAVPIETEEKVRLEGIRRSMKKNFLKSSIFLFLVLLLIGYFMVGEIVNDPVSFWTSADTLCWAVIVVLGILLMMIPLVGYPLWRRKSEKNIEQGGSCASTKGFRYASNILTALSALFALEWVVSLFFNDGGKGAFTLGYLAIIVVLTILLWKVRDYLKKQKFSRTANWTITIVVDVLMAFIMVGVLTAITLNSGILTGTPNISSHRAAGGVAWNPKEQQLPLTIEELGVQDTVEYTYSWTDSSSPFGSYLRGSQYSWDHAEHELRYELLEMKVDQLYDICFQHYWNYFQSKKEGATSTVAYQPVDAAPWGVEQAYRLYGKEQPQNIWLLRKGDRLVYLDATWELTQEQMAKIAQILGLK
jgi:hypothetical protein